MDARIARGREIMKAWVVDTCVVLDIALNDAAQGLITGNPTDFKRFHPGLNLLGP